MARKRTILPLLPFCKPPKYIGPLLSKQIHVKPLGDALHFFWKALQWEDYIEENHCITNPIVKGPQKGMMVNLPPKEAGPPAEVGVGASFS